MPTCCGVVNCGSRSSRDLVSFFRLPSLLLGFKHLGEKHTLCALRRKKWITALKRYDLTDKKLAYLRVCSKHFICGKPADLTDINNPDWVPTLNMGYKSVKNHISTPIPWKSGIRLVPGNQQLMEVKQIKEEVIESFTRFEIYSFGGILEEQEIKIEDTKVTYS